MRKLSTVLAMLFAATSSPVSGAISDYDLVGADLIIERYATFDIPSGEATEWPNVGQVIPTGLAYDDGEGVLYAVNALTNSLYSVNPATGEDTLIGELGVNDIGKDPRFHSLAYQETTGLLFAVDSSDGLLYSIDPASAEKTPVGNTGLNTVGALDFDPADGTLYAVDTFIDSLAQIDPLTAASNVIGQIGDSAIGGLAFDTGTGALFGLNGISHDLVAINTMTGHGTFVSPTTFSGVTALEFLPAVPEPSSVVLVALGAVSFSIVSRRTSSRLKIAHNSGPEC